MKILIDTHFLIWALMDSPKLTEKERQVLLDSNNEIFYSTVSIWELAIKNKKKKSFEYLPQIVDQLSVKAGFHELKLDKKHIFELATLGDIKNHKDPFDKILLAQAKNESFKFLTRDEHILEYNELCVIK